MASNSANEPPDRLPAGAAGPSGPSGQVSIGTLLHEAREAAGLSLEAVSERTKVRPGILADIEADNHASLPALTYTLGFVKAFARTVGIDPQMAADRYRTESEKGAPVPSMVDLEPLEARRLPSSGLVMVTTIAVALVLGLLTAWGAGWLAPSPPPATVDPLTVPDGRQPMADASQDGGMPPPASPPPADAAVRLVANDEVWLRITDGPAGETLFEGILARGEALDLPPGRAWQLRTGRAGALDVTVGGQPVPALGGPAEQVRAMPLTPQALTGRTPVAGLPGATMRRVPGLPDALPPEAPPARDSSPVNSPAATPGLPSPDAVEEQP